MMNKDVFNGTWNEMRPQLKAWWGNLSDDDLEQADGHAEQIIDLLQQRYGYTLKRAEAEFNRRTKDVKQAVAEV